VLTFPFRLLRHQHSGGWISGSHPLCRHRGSRSTGRRIQPVSGSLVLLCSLPPWRSSRREPRTLLCRPPRAIAAGELRGPVVLGRDHHDVAGTDSVGLCLLVSCCHFAEACALLASKLQFLRLLPFVLLPPKYWCLPISPSPIARQPTSRMAAALQRTWRCTTALEARSEVPLGYALAIRSSLHGLSS
jgi:hypothetical protein